jgi:hypothetical protein
VDAADAATVAAWAATMKLRTCGQRAVPVAAASMLKNSWRDMALGHVGITVWTQEQKRVIEIGAVSEGKIGMLGC